MLEVRTVQFVVVEFCCSCFFGSNVLSLVNVLNLECRFRSIDAGRFKETGNSLFVVWVQTIEREVSN